jgi:sugar phosphate isomerase/epimerase
MVSYEGFYDGGGSGLNPEYGIGFKMSGSHLGFPGSAQTANQLGEVVNAIKHGTKTFEVTMLDPNTQETIPKQHFEEMRALMKLTGIKPSVHAPLLDPAGFGEKGWSPEARADNERRMFDAIEKAQRLDPTGNLPIVLHSSNGAPGAEWRPGDEKKGEDRVVMDSATVINKETGQMQVVKRDYKFRPERPDLLEKGGKLFTAEGNVESINNGEWANRLTEVAQMSKNAGDIMEGPSLHLRDYANAAISIDGKRVVELDENGAVKRELDRIGEDKAGYYQQIRKGGIFVENAELAFVGAFNQAYKYGSPEQKEDLKKLAERYAESLGASADYVKIGSGEKDIGVNIMAPLKKQHLIDESLRGLYSITERNAPKIFELTENFAMEKAAETFGNLAARSYEKFKEKAPILAIENMYQGMAFSRAEDMKKLVEKSRDNFVEYLKGEGLSESEAKGLAKNKLGVTWDVGHLNIMKKKGFGDKDVIEETKKINEDKSMVKHIHLTDNFGYADTHLAPGMGNVPIKKILEELEKNGRFGEMRKIVEAPSMIQHFKVAPHSMTMAAFGSGIYGMKNGPTWDQAFNLQGNYFGGYGNLNPQTHHSYFGAGFTTMPVELGGQMAGGQSRFGGAPMA